MVVWFMQCDVIKNLKPNREYHGNDRLKSKHVMLEEKKMSCNMYWHVNLLRKTNLRSAYVGYNGEVPTIFVISAYIFL